MKAVSLKKQGSGIPKLASLVDKVHVFIDFHMFVGFDPVSLILEEQQRREKEKHLQVITKLRLTNTKIYTDVEVGNLRIGFNISLLKDITRFYVDYLKDEQKEEREAMWKLRGNKFGPRGSSSDD